MVKEKQIKDVESLRKFSDLYYKKSLGGLAPVEYLQKGQTYVFFNTKYPNDWQGGYCINSESDFRYLSGFTEEQKKEILLAQGLSENKISEIGCLWLNSKSLGVVGRLLAYSCIFFSIFKSDKNVILAGSFLRQLHGMQHRFFPHLLFEGVLKVAGKDANAKLYFAYKNELIVNFFRALMYDLKNTATKKGFFRKSVRFKTA